MASIGVDKKTLREKSLFAGDFHIVVHYEDTDFTGYVYHSNYLKYMERARSSFFGIEYLREMFLSHQHFVVAEANIKYLRAAKYGDQLIVRSKVSYSNSPAVTFFQDVYLIEEGSPTKKISEGYIKLVFVGETGGPIPLPKIVFEHIGHKLP